MLLEYPAIVAPARRLQLLRVLASSGCEYNPEAAIVDALAAREIDASTRDVLADADWLAARDLVGISTTAGGTTAVLKLLAPGLEIALGLASHPDILSARPGPEAALPGPGCASMADYYRHRAGEPAATLTPGNRYEIELGGGATLSICPDRPLRPETLGAVQDVARAAVKALTGPAAATPPHAASAHLGARETS